VTKKKKVRHRPERVNSQSTNAERSFMKRDGLNRQPPANNFQQKIKLYKINLALEGGERASTCRVELPKVCHQKWAGGYWTRRGKKKETGLIVRENTKRPEGKRKQQRGDRKPDYRTNTILGSRRLKSNFKCNSFDSERREGHNLSTAPKKGREPLVEEKANRPLVSDGDTRRYASQRTTKQKL